MFPGDSSRVTVYFMASHLVQERPVSHETPRPGCQLLLLVLLRIGGGRPEVQHRTSRHIYGAASPVLLTILAPRLTTASLLFSIQQQPWSFPAFHSRSRTTPSCSTASSTKPASLLLSIQPQTPATSAPAAACPRLPPWTPSASPPFLSVPLEEETSLWMI